MLSNAQLRAFQKYINSANNNMSVLITEQYMREKLAKQPVLAILRGLDTSSALAISMALYHRGIQVIEVPLTHENAFDVIRLLVKNRPADCLIGAGTVTTVAQVDKLARIGVSFIVSPNTDAEVIQAALACNLLPLPGVATATEAFMAYQAGAKLLKVFPAATYGPSHLSALSTVLPNDCALIAVGGVTLNDKQK